MRNYKYWNDKLASQELAKLLYENQGAMRFGSENRLYLVLIDKQDIQNSWEMKRDFGRLETEINKYLDSFDVKSFLSKKIDFAYSGKQYTPTLMSFLLLNRCGVSVERSRVRSHSAKETAIGKL